VFDPETLVSGGGIQREPSRRRIKDIAEYVGNSDASFPTPILLAIGSDHCILENGHIDITEDAVADIVDGQHRVLGLIQATNKNDFTLPVVFIVDATEEEKALLFATINGTQTKVPASLIYELFAVTQTRSPAKTCHEIARTLNSMPDSPWYRRLKMLGRKSVPGSTESLSQGTFIKFLMPHISANPAKDMDLLKNNKPPLVHPGCVFNEYFRKEKDSLILKVLLNIFGGARAVWPVEWEDPTNYVLTKTLGFTGIMKALPDMVTAGRNRNDLSVDHFEAVFLRVKQWMDSNGISLTSKHFSASASGEASFRDMIRQNVDSQA
jgi:DGQHR domain-containing protein